MKGQMWSTLCPNVSRTLNYWLNIMNLNIEIVGSSVESGATSSTKFNLNFELVQGSVELNFELFGAKHSPPSWPPWLTKGRTLRLQRKFMQLCDFIRSDKIHFHSQTKPFKGLLKQTLSFHLKEYSEVQTSCGNSSKWVGRKRGGREAPQQMTEAENSQIS